MMRKKMTCLLIAQALTCATCTLAAAQDGDASTGTSPGKAIANNSISIEPPAAPDQIAQPTADADADADVNDAIVTGEATDAPESERSLLETLPLGAAKPRATSNRSGDDGDAAASAADNGWLSSTNLADSELLRVGGALVVVLGLLWLMRMIVRRSGLVMNSAGRPSGVMEVLARYPVGRREHLVLLKLHRRVLLVHQGDGRMSPLAEVSEPNEVAALLARVEQGSSGRDATRFRSMLSQFNAEHEQFASPRRMPHLRRDTADSDIVDLTRNSPGRGLLRMNRSA